MKSSLFFKVAYFFLEFDRIMGILGISYALVLDRETSNIQLKLNHRSHQSFSCAERYNLITFKGVYNYIFSLKPDNIRPVS